VKKAAKSLAVRNAATLTRTHLISAILHSLFILLRFFLLSRSLTPYLILSAPALVLQFYLDRLGRPSYAADGSLRRAGEDLEAKGLTEFTWDIVYWTWINIVLVIVFGDKAWWLYLVVPGYSVYLAATTVGGMKGMLGGIGDGAAAPETESKRQKKMEKRGGQKVAYR
jgi:SRP-independent targeting protein 2/TMEM208